MGAAFERSTHEEIGPVKARLTQEGRADPLFRHFPDVFDAGEWHSYMPGLTDEAVVIAKSAGCPRQIVRFAKYAYAFQAHLEFNHDIIVAGLKNVDGDLGTEGPFVQTPEELLAYDYTQMNQMLSKFLDALAEALQDERA